MQFIVGIIFDKTDIFFAEVSRDANSNGLSKITISLAPSISLFKSISRPSVENNTLSEIAMYMGHWTNGFIL